PFEQWDADLKKVVRGAEASDYEEATIGVMARAPKQLLAMFAFQGALRKHSTLSARLRELVRLRIAFHNQCRSCMALRYRSAVEDGLTEGAVCSLEKPQEAADLSDAEKAALRYADLSANDHFSIDDAAFDALRAHFTEAEIVELGVFIAFFIGFGRLSAAWSMTEDLPDGYKAPADQVIAPWTQESVLVRGW